MCHDANGEEVHQCPQYHSSCVGVITEKFRGRLHQQHSSQHPEHHQGVGQAKDQQHLEHARLLQGPSRAFMHRRISYVTFITVLKCCLKLIFYVTVFFFKHNSMKMHLSIKIKKEKIQFGCCEFERKALTIKVTRIRTTVLRRQECLYSLGSHSPSFTMSKINSSC